jgi:hypothetical protein
MTETIIVAIITACAAVVPSLISILTNNRVIETKIEALTREVREHNNFARRVPVLEEKIEQIEKRIDEK